MAHRHLELVVDKWPIGPQNQMHRQGDRFFIDEHAAFILVGTGKARYVDESQTKSRVMTTENTEVLTEPKKRKYNRRDMKARD